MIAPLAKLIDWSTIQALAVLERPFSPQELQLEEALEFLKGPDFIPAESQPARVEFDPDESGRFHFPTPRPCGSAENNIVCGRLYRCAKHWQERPVIVLLHGRCDVFNHWYRFPWIARYGNRAGFNVATLVAPYYFQRRSRRPVMASHPGYLHLAETTAQAVAEIRALTGWLLKEGCPGVALWGVSYSAWLVGLTICHDARLAAAILTIPGGRLDSGFADLVLWRRAREALQKRSAALEALNLTALNLTTLRPAIPRENILLIDAIHDLMVPKEGTRELWQAWGQPDFWRLPHGHMSIVCLTGSGLVDRILRWLAPRLNPQQVH